MKRKIVEAIIFGVLLGLIMFTAQLASAQYIINTTALRLLNGSASIAGTIPGTIYYDQATDKFMFREGNAWVMLGSGSGGLTNGDKGDITISNLGATMLIDNGAITFAKMQTIGTNTLLGRISASTGLVEQLTPAQVNTMLPLFTRTLRGSVPPSGGTTGTANFLREDGAWAVPPGTGGAGSGTTETASNGLYKSGNDIRAGGPITENTAITIGNANQYRIVDTAADDYMFGINGFGRGGWNIGYGNLNVTTGQQAVMNIDPAGLYWRAQNSSSVGSTFSFRSDFVTFTDGRTSKRGIEYAAPGYVTQPQSLTDKQYVDQLVASVSNIQQFTSSTSGIVPPSGSSPATKILYGDGIWRTAPSAGTTYSVFTRSVNGLVPAPGGSTTTRYMREDGAWVTPPDANTTYSNFNASTAGLVPPSGTANATKVLYDDGVWRAASGPVFAEGTYTATVTIVNQATSASAGIAHYMRIGNRVFVNGSVTFTWSQHPGTARVDLSLPIASNFTTGNDAVGLGVKLQNSEPTANAYIQADATNDRVTFNVSEPDGTYPTVSTTFNYQYQYTVK